MGKVITFLLILIATAGFTLFAIGQPPSFTENANKANEYYTNKDFLNAAKAYNAAFRNEQGFATSNLMLLSAYCWDKAGFKDSAVINLLQLVYAFGYADTSELNTYFKRSALRHTGQFKLIFNRTSKNEALKHRSFLPDLASLMEGIYMSDQSTRTLSDPTAAIDQDQEAIQGRNMRLIDSIYNVNGWLASSQVGHKAAMAQFLVIQHSNLTTQTQWLPRIKEAVADGIMPPEYLALLTDRILVVQGKKQLYGTQLKYDESSRLFVSFPIQDRKKVNSRRLMFGMQRLENYLKAHNY
jgi:hypothetical protein